MWIELKDRLINLEDVSEFLAEVGENSTYGIRVYKKNGENYFVGFGADTKREALLEVQRAIGEAQGG